MRIRKPSGSFGPVQQCQLLGEPRTTCYYQPRPESPENKCLLRRLKDREHYTEVEWMTSAIAADGRGLPPIPRRRGTPRLITAIG